MQRGWCARQHRKFRELSSFVCVEVNGDGDVLRGEMEK